MKTLAALWTAGLLAAAGAPPPAPSVSARNAQAIYDGGQLLFAFDLAARSEAALAVRSVDYSVSIEGTRLFASSAQGFALAAGVERGVPIAGFGEAARAAAVLDRIEGTQQFGWTVTGTLHAVSAEGAVVDVAFSSRGSAATPEIPHAQSAPTALNHSLLAH